MSVTTHSYAGALAAVKDGMTAPMAGVTTDSPNDHLRRQAGRSVSKALTMNVNNGTQSIDAFQLTGTVLVKKLYGYLTDATTLTNCTAAHFELYDGAAAVDLTKNDGVLSALPVGTFVCKHDLATVTMGIADSTNGALTEATADKQGFKQFLVTQKTGQNTYIRFTYTSNDTPAAAELTVYCEYIALDDTGAVAAV